MTTITRWHTQTYRRPRHNVSSEMHKIITSYSVHYYEYQLSVFLELQFSFHMVPGEEVW